MSESKLDTTYALYIFAGIFFVVSVIYFGAEVIFQLSPVTKSLLLLSLTDLIILTGIYSSSKIRSIVAYLIGFISYIIFLTYSLAVFEPSTELTLGFLLASAIAFAALGKAIDDGKLTITPKRFKMIAALLLVAATGITAADMVGAQVEYQATLEDTVNIQEGSNHIGELTAVNSYYLTRSYEIPDYGACAFNPERRNTGVNIADYRTDSGNLAGGTEKRFNITIDSRAIPDEPIEIPSERQPIRGEFNIERSESCPSDGENGTIYVFEDAEEDRFD